MCVSTRRCTNDDCQKTVTESLVFISDDLQHDFHAVNTFTAKALGHLRDQRGLTVERVVQWTDGCASQYKSYGPFSDISHSGTVHGATMYRNFFGSRHGKGYYAQCLLHVHVQAFLIAWALISA